MATLDDLLALLPDNTTGAIDAADLRTIVTELHRLASAVGQVFAYQYTTNTVPAAGRLTLDAWSLAATELRLSEATADGTVLGFGLVDSAIEDRVQLRFANGSTMLADIVGPSVDNGTYRTLTISVLELTGASGPANNSDVALTFLGVVS